MRILGIVPARGGSKGVPGKNIRMLHGKPLLWYTARVALACTELQRVVLSTEDNAIAEVGIRSGLEVPFMRPPGLALDDTPTVDVILHTLNWLEAEGESYDAVCLLQVTSPFRTPKSVSDAIQKFQKGQFDSLVSVRRVPDEYNPHWTFEASADGVLQIATGDDRIISRRQDLPPAYYRDGSLYMATVEAIRRHKSLLGERLGFYESVGVHVNIDTLSDWDDAERLAKGFFSE